MKQCFLICFLSLSLIKGFGQKVCDFTRSFDSVRLFMKENYAGYDDKVKPANQKAFDQFTAKHISLVKKAKNEAQYTHVVASWLQFFKDRHVSVSVPFDTANGSLSRKIAETENAKVDAALLRKLEQADPSSIEGIYHTRDTSYKVAVIKSDNGFRQYAAVILTSKAPEWKTGNIKFELVKAEDKVYNAIWYNKYHHPIFSRLDFTKGNAFPAEGWYKAGYNASEQNTASNYKPLFEEENKYNAFFKQLDDQTGYIRIGSFDARFAGQIDSVVKTNQDAISKLPHLVIDIRGNGGGADLAYRPFKKLMYTDPVKSIGVDLLATRDNIDITRQLIHSIEEIPASDKKEYDELLDKASKSNTRMFDFFADRTDTLEGTPFPQKIAIVMDGRCASTAEQFLLEARQSRKVTLFGTHTMGVLDYSNVREKEFSCPAISLHYASTRSRRVDIGQGIDNVGIMPDVPLDFSKENWLKEVTDRLK